MCISVLLCMTLCTGRPARVRLRWAALEGSALACAGAAPAPPALWWLKRAWRCSSSSRRRACSMAALVVDTSPASSAPSGQYRSSQAPSSRSSPACAPPPSPAWPVMLECRPLLAALPAGCSGMCRLLMRHEGEHRPWPDLRADWDARCLRALPRGLAEAQECWLAGWPPAPTRTDADCSSCRRMSAGTPAHLPAHAKAAHAPASDPCCVCRAACAPASKYCVSIRVSCVGRAPLLLPTLPSSSSSASSSSSPSSGDSASTTWVVSAACVFAKGAWITWHQAQRLAARAGSRRLNGALVSTAGLHCAE